MARPDFNASTTTRLKWNGATDWNNSRGDWWDKTAAAQGSTAWASTLVSDTDTERDITFDVTEWAQAVYDNADWTSAVLLRASGGTSTWYRQKSDSTAAYRPKISYDGGANQECTDSCVLEVGSSGGVTTSPYYVIPGDAQMLIEFPAPTSRPTSATITLRTTAQFGDVTTQVFWLRYPPESAPTISSPPAAPSGVTVGSITATSASVSWTDNSANETGFKVRYAPSPYSSWTTATGSVAASPYLVTGLADGTSYKAGVAAFNVSGDSTWAESGVFTTTALTRLRPSADTSKGSWSASSGSVLYSMIDEANADDTDYITAATNTTCKIKFENGTDPVSGANHLLRVRARGTGGTLRAELVQSATPETTIASWSITYTASFTDFDLSLTSAQADAITDYSALYVKLISS